MDVGERKETGTPQVEKTATTRLGEALAVERVLGEQPAVVFLRLVLPALLHDENANSVTLGLLGEGRTNDRATSDSRVTGEDLAG